MPRAHHQYNIHITPHTQTTHQAPPHRTTKPQTKSQPYQHPFIILLDPSQQLQEIRMQGIPLPGVPQITNHQPLTLCGFKAESDMVLEARMTYSSLFPLLPRPGFLQAPPPL